MEHLSAWLGAGVVTAGVSAALLAGAGVASAETDSGSDGGGTSTSDSSKPDADSADSTTPDKPNTTPSKPATSVGAPESTQDDADEVESPASPASTGEDADEAEEPAAKPAKRSTTKKKAADVESAPATVAKPAESTQPATAESAATAEPAEQVVTETTAEAPAVVNVATSDTAAPARKAAPTAALVSARAVVAPAVAPPAPSLVGLVASVVASVVVNVGSIALSALQAIEALAAGPPVLPPGSTVTVRDSWITLGNGQRIAANWYYPDGDTPPERLVVLQHGFLALGPMYSYTAANLAERTHSIVVTPTIPSNIFLGDDHWLGGAGMASEIADLFVGDRTALTQSALDAGFATRYGLDPATATLPQKFALMGHSLGGNLVPAAAGFLALNGGAADLVGVITLDGVPLAGTMETALDRLADYEDATGHYIPIREIGAPRNLYNSTSTINAALSAARPDHFNGVVLTDGVHMDSMRGGNPLIQFAAYVAAGFPTPQNPLAVEELAVQWLDEWFGPDAATGGDPFVGDGDLIPGSTFDIDTPKGTAEATVIGNPLALRSLSEPFAMHAPTDLPPADALLTALAV